MFIMKKCFCFNIRTAGFILGWIGLVGGIINTIDGIYWLPVLLYDNRRFESEAYVEISRAVIQLSIGGGIIEILSNTALLWGINKNNKLGLIPWLVTSFVAIFVFALTVLVVGTVCYFKENANLGVIIHLFGIPISCLFVYFWCCIWSIYNKIKLDEKSAPNVSHEEGGNLVGGVYPASMTTVDLPPPYKSLKI